MSALRKALPALGALALLAGFYLAVYGPLQARLSAAQAELLRAQNRLGEARVFADLHSRLGRVLEGRTGGANLMTKLDQLVRERGLKDRVAQMQAMPAKAPQGGITPRESALVRLDRLDLEQLSKVLRGLDGLSANVWVRKMEIRRQGTEEALAIFEIDEIEAQ